MKLIEKYTWPADVGVEVKFMVTNESDKVTLRTNPSSKNTINHIEINSDKPSVIVSNVAVTSDLMGLQMDVIYDKDL